MPGMPTTIPRILEGVPRMSKFSLTLGELTFTVTTKINQTLKEFVEKLYESPWYMADNVCL
jgi:hypothetical protein